MNPQRSLLLVLRPADARPSLRGRVRLAFALVALLACCTGCINLLPPGPEDPSLTPSERMMLGTYALASRKGMATGFVVCKRDSKAPGGVVPVVVTAGHVLDTVGAGPLYVGARVPDSRGEPRVVVMELQARDMRSPYWVRHPKYDIAAFALKMTPAAARQIPIASCMNERTVGHPFNVPRIGDEVSFLGYPEVLPGTDGGFPVLRSGKVASYTTAAFRQQRKFLVNADVYPGDSGSPVFQCASRGGKPQLVGMLVQRVGPDRNQFVPLALAVDAGAIRETLDMLDAREVAAGEGIPGR